MFKYKATKQICEDKREKNNREKGSAVVMFKEKALNTRHNMILPHVTLCVIFLKLIECSAQRLYNRLLRVPFQKKGNSRHCGIRDSIESLILRLLLDFKIPKKTSTSVLNAGSI